MLSTIEPGAGPADRGVCVALIFALVAERLAIYYDQGHWLNQAQGTTLTADWLSRSKQTMPMALRKQLSELSEQMAKQITSTLSREAGLTISHEMQESLDTRHQSEIGITMMAECARLLDNSALT